MLKICILKWSCGKIMKIDGDFGVTCFVNIKLLNLVDVHEIFIEFKQKWQCDHNLGCFINIAHEQNAFVEINSKKLSHLKDYWIRWRVFPLYQIFIQENLSNCNIEFLNPGASK